MKLLDLPVESIHEALLYLPLKGIHACLLTCGVLYELINNSTEIAYNIELELAGVDENPCSPALSGLSVSDKLELLRERERRWLSLAPAEHRVPRCVVPIPGPTGAELYDLLDGGMLVTDWNPDLPPSPIQYLPIPPAPGPDNWKTLFSGKSVIEFATDGHDLLVVYTSTPIAGMRLQIEAHFLHFPAGRPHPDAAVPTIQLFTAVHHFDISHEVVDSTVVLLCGHDEFSELQIYDWVSGCPIIEPVRFPLDTELAGLLDQHTIVLVVPHSMELRVVPLPQDSTPCAVPLDESAFVSFSLPRLRSGWAADPSSFKSVGESGFRSRRSPPSRPRDPATPAGNPPFLIRDATALMVIAYDVAVNDRDYLADYYSEVEVQLLLVIRRNSLLEAFIEARTDHRHSVPWHLWGLRSARYLEGLDIGIRGVAGQRLASIPPDSQNSPAQISILDFNPGTYKMLRRACATSAAARPSKLTSTRTLGDLSWDDKGCRFLLGTDRDASQVNLQLVCAMRGLLQLPAPISILATIFAEPSVALSSELAYLKIISAQNYAFARVHLMNSTVAGVLENDEGDVSAADFLYLG
ncbi:hypothetical protein MKEN_01020900 [Mycena kentingensis (nom. inval.)]|nr:hypothetical protein MKEN_01020900 [Mycena kentingensis (nom. inval.)]